MKLYIPLWVRVLPIYALIAGITFMPVAAKNIRSSGLDKTAASLSRTIISSGDTARISGTPKHLIIASVGIDLDIVRGTYSVPAGWTVAPTDANYATTAPLPNNQSGNTILYGHDISVVFKATDNLRIGDVAYVTTETGDIFSYSYRGDSIVSPTDTSVFDDAQDGSPRLTLITCSGSLSQTRRIMNFTFNGVGR